MPKPGTARLRLNLNGDDVALRQLIDEIGRERFERLLTKAFPDISMVELTSIRQGMSGARVFKARVIGEHQGQQVSQILKVGPEPDLVREIANLTRAEPFLQTVPLLFGRASDAGWMVLDYRFEGISLADRLLECRDQHQIPRGGAALESVFDYLRELHATSRRDVLCNLVFEEYPLQESYFDAFEVCQRTLERNASNQDLAPFQPLSSSPEYWRAPARIFETHTHACHGDLHADNVVLNAANGYAPCAIDFYHFDESHHFLKDYVALEADLALRVLAPGNWNVRGDLETYCAALRILYESFEVNISQFHGAGTGVKALADWTKRIREAAWAHMDKAERHISEYFLGLLRYAVRRCGQLTNNLTQSQRWIAGHSANNLERHLQAIMNVVHVHHDVTPEQTTPSPTSQEPPEMHTPTEPSLVSRYLDELNKLVTFKDRLNLNSDLKRWIAEYVFTVYGVRMFRERARNLFFESGSSIAYLAIEMNEQLKKRRGTLDLNAFSVETNNIFACLEFALKSPIEVSLFPSGPPEPKYGATFGPLEEMLGTELPEDMDWAPHLEPDDEKVIAAIKVHFERKYKDTGVIFMTASGVEFSETSFVGPHVGSYSNMLFKRILLGSGCPTVMVLDQDKIPAPFRFGSCYPVCHGDFTWERVCQEVPLAIAVGLMHVAKARPIIEHFRPLGLINVHEGRKSETPTGLILSNDKFEACFPRTTRG